MTCQKPIEYFSVVCPSPRQGHIQELRLEGMGQALATPGGVAVVTVVSHILRSWLVSDRFWVNLQSEIAQFRNELVLAEQTVLRSQQSLDNCLSWVSIQNFLLKVLGVALVQVVVVFGVCYYLRDCRRPREVGPVTVAFGDDCLVQEALTDQDAPAVGAKPIGVEKVSGRGPLRPSDLNKMKPKNPNAHTHDTDTDVQTQFAKQRFPLQKKRSKRNYKVWSVECAVWSVKRQV